MLSILLKSTSNSDTKELESMKQLLSMTIALLVLSGCALPSWMWIEQPRKSEMVQNYYLERARRNLAASKRAIDKAKTREDALKLVEKARRRVRNTFANVRSVKPVKSRMTGVTDFPDYVVEKHLIRTRDNFTMTVSLFLPKNCPKPLPAVIFLSGHSKLGRLDYHYSTAQMAKRGLAVLSADPIHQGERQQFKDINSVGGNNLLNRQLLTLGDDFAQWRLHDAVQLINFLETRKDIDRKRIAVHGNSGGGTMTAFLAAYDRRIAFAAPCCYITTFYHNILNELPADGEQAPSRFLANGGEMIDLILAHAPKPYLIMSQEYDFFDIRGTRETYAMAKKIYKLLGAEENIAMVTAPGVHNLDRKVRELAYPYWKKFFNLNCSLKDEKVPRRNLEALYSTPTGQVLEMPGENSAQQLIIREMKKIEKQRTAKKLNAAAVKKRVRQLLNIPSVIKVPEYRMLRHARDTKGIPLRRMGLETEKGILVTLYSKGEVLPLKEKIELIISEKGSYNVLGAAVAKDPEAEVRALDYRGCGDSLSYAGFHANYDQDYFYSSLGVMWNEPMIGRRVLDILATIKFLKANGVKTITLRSEGLGIIPAIFAAVLSEEPVKLDLENQKIPTYTGHVLDPAAPIPQSFIPSGILKVTDLDELIRLFPDKFIR